MEGEIDTIPNENCFETIDFSNFNIERINDDTINYSGYMKILRSMENNVYKIHVSSEVLDEKHQEWHVFPFKQYYPNLCESFLKKESPVYSITKKFTECPAKIGVSLVCY